MCSEETQPEVAALLREAADMLDGNTERRRMELARMHAMRRQATGPIPEIPPAGYYQAMMEGR